MKPSMPLQFRDEVRDALTAGQPVVALETNVIVHGLPYPDNIVAARKVEHEVRAAGAVPATIWIEKGQIMIGAGENDIERLASGKGIPKVSSRDMAVILATGGVGATTVSASLVVSALAGIRFFSSAGIGGVHRGGETTMDISPDLFEFTRSKVAVVCAGAKSILDIKRTAEFLETHCVPVISYGSDDFPAFYCMSSGVRAPQRLDDELLIAHAIQNHWDLGQHTSVLVTTPISKKDAIPAEEIDAMIEEAMLAAERDNVCGSEVTTYLMRALHRATEGRSVQANTSVLASTAALAGRIAVAYAAMHRGEKKV